jgi:predicted site-specific integrase-resolvase
MQMLELPGYTVNEFERLAGLPKNTAYKLIRHGELEAMVDIVGQYRIPYGEAALFVRMKEQEVSQK